MKIGQYNDMMSYLTRPEFSDGSGKKPTTIEDLKKSGKIVTGDKYKPSNPKLIQSIRRFEIEHGFRKKNDAGGRANLKAGTIPGGYTDDAYAYIRKIENDILESFIKYKAGGGKLDFDTYSSEAKRAMFEKDTPAMKAEGGRVNLADGTEEIVEPSKSMQVDTTTKGLPDPLEEFKKQSDLYLQASFASTNKDYFNSLIEQEYNKALDAGVQPQEALSFLKERSQMYRTLAEEGRMQGEPAILGPSYGRDNKAIGGGVVEGEDLGTREGFNQPKDPNIEFPFKHSTGATDYGIGRFKDTGKYFRRVGRNKAVTILQEEGESLEDFKKRKGPRVDKAFDKTITTRQYIDNWTKNWLDNNLQKYGVRDFDVMLNDLSNDWQNEIETGNVPEPKKNFNLSSPKLNLPNITASIDVRSKKLRTGESRGLKPFTYDDITFYRSDESSEALKNKTLAQWKKIFYKNKISTDPVLRQGLKEFYDFMAQDKSGLSQKGGLTIRDFLRTKVSDDVQFLIDREASGLDKAAKKEVFHSFPDLKNNYDIFTGSKARLKAIERETEGKIKAGEKTSAQTDELIKQIKAQNKIVAEMKPEELLKDKKLIQSLRLVINSQTGQVSFVGYTENDPRVNKKGVKNDLELAEHAIDRAKKGSLFSYDHISKRSLEKMNTQFPNNIQGANYITNTQMENAKRFLAIPANRNTPAAQNIDKVLSDLNLTVRGKEYGGTYGNKESIVFDSNTNRSNIVDSQLIKKNVIPGRLAKAAGLAGVLFSTAAFGKEKSTLPEGSPGQINQEDKSLIEEYPLLTGAAAAATPLATKTGRKIYGALAKPLLRALGSVPAATYFAGQELTKEDPNYAIAGAELLLPELGKRIPGSGTGIMSKIGRFALNPIGRLARGFTPIGIGLQGVELVNQAMKEQKRINEMRENDPEAYQQFIAEQEDMMRESAAYGGRMSFAEGPEDPSKRKFMKIMGGLASLPIIGRFFDVAKEAAPVLDAVKTEVAKGKPEWFDALVNKVIREGTDMTKQFATKEREIIHATKISDDEYVRVVQDLDEGTVRVEYESPENVYGDQVVLEYKKPLPDEGDPRPTAEFSTAESGPVGRVVAPDDVELDVDEVGGTSIEDLDSDVSKLKEYATGKKPTMKEIVQNKKRKDKAAAITDDIDGAASDAVVRRQGDYDPSDYED